MTAALVFALSFFLLSLAGALAGIVAIYKIMDLYP